MIKFLIYRPIGVMMSFLGIIILGILAINYIPVSLMPDIDIPEITININAENYSARDLEDLIVKPLRSNLMQVNHVDDIQSKASNGNANIRLRFVAGTEIDYSFIEVNEKVDRAMIQLPKELERPKVIKASPTDIPIFYLNLNLHEQNSIVQQEVSQQFVDLNRFVNQVISKRIEQIPEVAMVDISGMVYPEIVIEPNYQKLVGLGIGIEELEVAIKRENIDVKSILVKNNHYQYNLQLGTKLKNIKDIENIYIKRSDKIYRLKELAKISASTKKRRGLILSNDSETVAIAIIKRSDAQIKNLKVSLDATIGSMKEDYPELNFSISRDQSKLLNFAIANLQKSLFLGIILAILTMVIFLRNLQSAILISVSVPFSIIISLLFFYLFNISLNIISLSGLILGAGLIIDNSIIVIDNITYFRKLGFSIEEACIFGVNEIFRPLLTSVLTTCAVFIPLILLSGLAGALFFDQAIAITIGLFVSFLVSITLLPILFKVFHSDSWLQPYLRRINKKLKTPDFIPVYTSGFNFTMRHHGKVLGIFVFLFLLAIGFFYLLPKKQMPELTTSEVLVRIDWNEPISIEENKHRILRLIGEEKSNLINYTAYIGNQQFMLNQSEEATSSQTSVYLKAQSPEKLNISKASIQEYLKSKFDRAIVKYENVDNIFNNIFSDDLPLFTAKLRNTSSLGSSRDFQLNKIWSSIQIQLRDLVIPPLAFENQVAILVDKSKLILYGVSTDLVNKTLQSAFNEREVITIMDNENFIPVILGGEEKSIDRTLRTTNLKVNDSTYYALNIFTSQINVQELRTITAGLGGEYYPINLNIESNEKDEVIAEIESVVNKNQQYEVDFSGRLFENDILVKDLLFVLFITVILLYFILASQFESLKLPLIILSEIPIAIAGSFLFLYLFGMSINLMSMIGIVVMTGIVINDSILKIDTIIQLRRQGQGVLKALFMAGKRRLRPVLMTSITTILTLMPVLFANGLGGELQAPLAVALIGGIIIGTVASLYFIPLCYYYFTKQKSYEP